MGQELARGDPLAESIPPILILERCQPRQYLLHLRDSTAGSLDILLTPMWRGDAEKLCVPSSASSSFSLSTHLSPPTPVLTASRGWDKGQQLECETKAQRKRGAKIRGANMRSKIQTQRAMTRNLKCAKVFGEMCAKTWDATLFEKCPQTRDAKAQNNLGTRAQLWSLGSFCQDARIWSLDAAMPAC